MPNIVLSLLIGVVILAISFWSLRRFARLSSASIAMLQLLLTVLLYGGWLIWEWPGLDVAAIHIAFYLLTIYIGVLLSMSADRSESVSPGQLRRRWHWGPIVLVGFFTVVIVVNTVFVMLAHYGTETPVARWFLPEPAVASKVESVFPGVVSHDFREKESQFNDYQQQRAVQQQRGWQIKQGWQDHAVANQKSVLLLEVKDKSGQAINDAQISGKFLYRGDSRLDQPFTMQSIGVGLYRAELVLPRAGRWDQVLRIQRGKDSHELRTSTDVD